MASVCVGVIYASLSQHFFVYLIEELYLSAFFILIASFCNVILVNIYEHKYNQEVPHA